MLLSVINPSETDTATNNINRESKKDDDKMNFRLNYYTTIKNFKRLGTFSTFTKFGEPEKYENFEGVLNGEKMKGFISTVDNNIYKLTKI